MSTPTVGAPRLAGGLSGHLDPIRAVEQACDQCLATLAGAPVDAAVLLVSKHHAPMASSQGDVLRKKLSPGVLVGVTGESVIGGETELEGVPGVSVLALSLPGATVRGFSLADLPVPQKDAPPAHFERFAQSLGMTGEHRGTLLFLDPFSVPVNVALPLISRARPQVALQGDAPRQMPIIGGMASAGTSARGNVLLLDDRVLREGGVGITFGGRIRLDAVVSQGCRGFGPVFEVTHASGQVLRTLSGRPALQVLSEQLDALSEDERALLKGGVFVGRVIDTSKQRLGRDDFLIRNIVGVDRTSGALGVADLLGPGERVRFHLRDATTANDDLAMLLDAQKLREPPLGALLITCNGRGSRLFEMPHHDAASVVRAFAGEPAATEKAVGGRAIGRSQTPARPLPLAGFFAAGEVGPIGGETFLHGQTACVGLFRPEPGTL